MPGPRPTARSSSLLWRTITSTPAARTSTVTSNASISLDVESENPQPLAAEDEALSVRKREPLGESQIGRDGARAPAHVPGPPPNILTGEAGAPGRCEGRARLVRDPGDFERVGVGDVLVAVYTDPGWTSVLERAAGLVLETGGILSHGAIVARELGIPAVADVASATALLATGDRLAVDGTTGEIAVLDA